MDRLEIRKLSPLQIGYGIITKKLELCEVQCAGFSGGDIRYFKAIAFKELKRQLEQSDAEDFGGIEDLPGIDGRTVVKRGLRGNYIPIDLETLLVHLNS
jgi:hypothetical protein